MRSFLTAVGFLTRLPLPRTRELSAGEAASSMIVFPLVGAIMGLLLVLCDALLRVLLPDLPAVALLLVVWVLLSGGLHLDGFIDCCDALWVAKPPEVRLDILKDVHVGAYGVFGAGLLLLVKFVALVSLPAAWRWPLLLLTPTLGRWAMVYATERYPYARRHSGLGLWFKSELGPIHLLAASAIALTIALAIHPWLGPAALLLAWLGTLLLAGWVRPRLGGLTGDTYGMICEVLEPALLLAGISVARLLPGIVR